MSPSSQKSKKEWPPLTGSQVNYALEVIEKRKRLAETPLAVVWPFLGYICCCCFRRRKNFNSAIKKSLRKRMALHVSKSDQAIEDDPYLLLGFGMTSYFDVMLSLMSMMIFISKFAIGFMVLYSGYDALSNQAGFHVYSMGNMGGAETICAVQQITEAQAQLHLSCTAGTISTTAVAQSTQFPII